MKNKNYKNFELLCAFLAEKGGSRSISYTESKIRSINWAVVFQLADEYLVLPALYLGLKRNGCLEFLDSEARGFLETIHAFNCEHNRKLKLEALKVIRELNSQGIQPILLKGIAGLFTGLYEDDGERILSDIDLLVDQSELVTVVRLLMGRGYRCDSVEICDQVFEGAFFERELTIMTESYSTKIDLHVRPTGSSGHKAFVSIEGAREGAEVVEIEGAYAILPAPFFRLLHNFYHAQHLDRSYLSGQICLRQLVDWAVLWKHYGDEACFEKIENQVRSHRKLLSHRLYLLNAGMFLKLRLPKSAKISWIERLLLWRQKLCVQSVWFSWVNWVFVYTASVPLLFSPEWMRLSFGDLPLKRLIIMRIKRLLEPSWYLLRIREIKRLY